MMRSLFQLKFLITLKYILEQWRYKKKVKLKRYIFKKWKMDK